MPSNDPADLRATQYHDARHLNARMALHQRFATNPQDWQRWVFDQLALPAHARVLELGCGSAALWCANLERIPPGWRITLSDFSPGMLADAQRALGAHASRFHFQVVDAQAIPCAAASLDGVIANHMLYHVPDRPRALAEIARVLVPGAALYAATNGPRHMAECDALVVRFDPAQAGAPRVSQPFDLENGAAQLERFFAVVSLRRLENALVVTEADPLADYILSLPYAAGWSAARQTELRTFVARALAAEGGATRIGSEAGLFQALRTV